MEGSKLYNHISQDNVVERKVSQIVRKRHIEIIIVLCKVKCCPILNKTIIRIENIQRAYNSNTSLHIINV